MAPSLLNLASLLMGSPLRAMTGIVAVERSAFKARSTSTPPSFRQKHIKQDDILARVLCARRKTLLANRWQVQLDSRRN
jgi:hypothetical protein